MTDAAEVHLRDVVKQLTKERDDAKEQARVIKQALQAARLADKECGCTTCIVAQALV